MKTTIHHRPISLLVEALLISALAMPSLFAEDGKKRTRDEMVLDDRDALADSAHWIYNDLGKAFAEAESSGLPLMVVHRCIP